MRLLGLGFVATVLACTTMHAADSKGSAVQDTLPSVIRTVYLDQRNVFDEHSSDWFFGAEILNALHTLTKPYIIEDEMLLYADDDVDTVRLLEMERNLRRTGLFSSVTVSTDPKITSIRNPQTGKVFWPDSMDVIIKTQDRFSLRPAILFGTGGDITNIGAKLEESNFLGTATQITLQGLYRTENSIGWEGYTRVAQRRLMRSEVGMEFILQANQYRTDQLLSFYKQYRTMETPWAFAMSALNAFGRDFAYRGTESPELLPFHNRALSGFASQAYGDKDRLFVSVAASVNDVNRTVPESRQAFDNTGYLLVSFSSLSQRYSRTAFLDGYETEDLMEGGWGNAAIGRVFSMGNGGQTMWYVGGEAEQSWFPANGLYLFGQVNGASGFGKSTSAGTSGAGTQGYYTSVGLSGLAHWRPQQNIVLASRLQSQTVWNWNAFHQLVLDLETGLRGYPANRLAADNRVVANTEFRWFPGWKWWIVGVSTVAFWDMGTVWNQGTAITGTQFHHALGLGLRIHNLKASGADAVFRLDFAYSMDEKKFTGIIFTTSQLFSAFGKHQYKAPRLYGTDVDLR